MTGENSGRATTKQVHTYVPQCLYSLISKYGGTAVLPETKCNYFSSPMAQIIHPDLHTIYFPPEAGLTSSH